MNDISVTMRNNSVTTKVAFFLGGREDVLHPRLQCDAAGVGVLSIFFSTGSPFGHHPWKVDKPTLRHRRCRTAATPTHLSFSLNACSATPLASEFSLSSSPRVHPSGITRG